jgi:hypothetical protein
LAIATFRCDAELGRYRGIADVDGIAALDPVEIDPADIGSSRVVETRRAYRLLKLAFPPDLIFPSSGKSGYSESSMGK